MNIEKQKNKLIIISSPSGAGKTTLCKLLRKKMKNISLSISYTTRTKRVTEINKRDYFFINHKNFTKLKNKKFFIETANIFDNLYGTPYPNNNKLIKKNNHILFDIDWQGARKLRRKYPKEQIIDFFILPPSKKELKKRLEKRGRDNKQEIKKRLSHAMSEMSHYSEYKYILINDKIKETVDSLVSIINYNLLISDLHKKIKKKLKIIK